MQFIETGEDSRDSSLETRAGSERESPAWRAIRAGFVWSCDGALKLLGESYPFAPGGACLLTTDNHNSANGIREYASAKGASRTHDRHPSGLLPVLATCPVHPHNKGFRLRAVSLC